MILVHIMVDYWDLLRGGCSFCTKGSRLHPKSGMIFVYAMLILSTSRAVRAALITEGISVIVGLPTFYLVITALLAGFGDARMLLSRNILWAHHIARHLWRMCFAL